MIPNGKEMNWNGHHLVFESTTYECRGCFFEKEGQCPDCDEGIWVEENPSPWHTGIPTEDGLYIIIIHPYGSYANEPRYFCYTIEDGILKDCIDDGNIDADDFWSQYAIAWQKIEPYKEEK